MRASDVKPIAYMKTHSAQLVADVNETRKPVFITQRGVPRAVIMDVRSYESMQDALILMKMISQSEEEFRKGDWLTQKQMEQAVQATLGA